MDNGEQFRIVLHWRQYAVRNIRDEFCLARFQESLQAMSRTCPVFILLVECPYQRNFFWIDVIHTDVFDLLVVIEHGNAAVVRQCRHDYLCNLLQRDLLVERVG